MLLEYLRRHPRLSTVIAVLVAAAVTVFLFVLSSTGSEKGEGVPASPSAAPAPPAPGGIDPGTLLGAEETAGRQLLAPEHRDLDGDGQAETLVMAQGEGEDRLLDWYVYGYQEGRLVRLFSRTGVVQGELSFDRPWIEEREASFEPGDPACCPSAFVVSRYTWENGALVLMDRTKAPAL